MGAQFFRLLTAASAIGTFLVVPSLATASESDLEPFNSCSQFVDYAKQQSQPKYSSRYDYTSPQNQVSDGVTTMPSSAPTSSPSSSSESTATGESDQKSENITNVQEVGIDEPDIVKASGSTIFAIFDGKFYAIDSSDDKLRTLDSIELPKNAYGSEILIEDGRALLITKNYASSYSGYITELIEVDIHSPSDLHVLNSAQVEGDYQSARLSNGTARVVISGGLNNYTSEDQSQPQTWMPEVTLRRGLKGQKRERPLSARCTNISHPDKFAGVGMISVLTINMQQGLATKKLTAKYETDAVFADSETVYASPSSLYIATTDWVSGASGSQYRTEIHKFDTSHVDDTKYSASGTVRGELLNQFSMSEKDGKLRVATTDTSYQSDSVNRESFVTVLAQNDADQLVQVGQVGGLGRDERIYAVRFIGDVGFVVTFRQMDPLYTVDLSDPSQPKVVGELKIPGYSAYLHPVSEKLLLGVGQDSTDRGVRKGAQLSLFDISDLAHPQRVATASLGEYSSSDAEQDHHAFLYSGKEKLVVVPVKSYYENGLFNGALGFRVSEDGLKKVAEITHKIDSQQSYIRRSFILKDRLFTLSDAGIKTSDLGSFAEQSWLQLGSVTSPTTYPTVE